MGSRVANVPGFAGELQGVGTGPRASTRFAWGLGFWVLGHSRDTVRVVFDQDDIAEEGLGEVTSAGSFAGERVAMSMGIHQRPPSSHVAEQTSYVGAMLRAAAVLRCQTETALPISDPCRPGVVNV